MRPLFALVGALLTLCIPQPAAAGPSLDDLFADEKTPKTEKKQPRDVLKFNPHTVATVEDLLVAIYQVDWWVTQSAKQFEVDDARREILEVHLDLLESWVGGLDPEAIVAEARDPHFDPSITFTERIFLSWDWQTTAPEEWREVRDRALDDLRLKHPERALARYREFRTTHEVVATPDQVLFFLRQIGAARIHAGGPAWRLAMIEVYREQAEKLLGQYPRFAGMGRYGDRASILETLYEDPVVRPMVWRIRTILDMLTASGPEGYAALLEYREQYGARAFLPYPEKIALDGGGLGQPLLEQVLGESTMPASRRKGLLAVALDHAQKPVANGITFPEDLLKGRISLYPYTPEQRSWLENKFREFLVAGEGSGVQLESIFPPEGGAAKLPTGLRSSAMLVLEMDDPLAEVELLLASNDVQAQAVGLSALVLGLEESGNFTNEEWIGTEAKYLELIRPFLASSTIELRDLTLLVLTKFAASPTDLDFRGNWMLEVVLPMAIQLQHDPSPDRAAVARILALSMHRRGIGIRQLWGLIDAVDVYAESLDPAKLGLDAAIELLNFVRAVSDPEVQPPNGPAFIFPILEPDKKLAVIATALDRMTLFSRFQNLELLVDDLAYLKAAGHGPSEAVREELTYLADRRESLMIHPDVAARIDQLLESE